MAIGSLHITPDELTVSCKRKAAACRLQLGLERILYRGNGAVCEMEFGGGPVPAKRRRVSCDKTIKPIGSSWEKGLAQLADCVEFVPCCDVADYRQRPVSFKPLFVHHLTGINKKAGSTSRFARLLSRWVMADLKIRAYYHAESLDVFVSVTGTRRTQQGSDDAFQKNKTDFAAESARELIEAFATGFPGGHFTNEARFLALLAAPPIGRPPNECESCAIQGTSSDIVTITPAGCFSQTHRSESIDDSGETAGGVEAEIQVKRFSSLTEEQAQKRIGVGKMLNIGTNGTSVARNISSRAGRRCPSRRPDAVPKNVFLRSSMTVSQRRVSPIVSQQLQSTQAVSIPCRDCYACQRLLRHFHRRAEWFMCFFIDGLSAIDQSSLWTLFLAFLRIPKQFVTTPRTATAGSVPLTKSNDFLWQTRDDSILPRFVFVAMFTTFDTERSFGSQNGVADLADTSILLSKERIVRAVSQGCVTSCSERTVSQAMVMPFAQRSSLASILLDKIYQSARDLKIQFSVEKPAPSFEQLRNVTALLRCVRERYILKCQLTPTASVHGESFNEQISHFRENCRECLTVDPFSFVQRIASIAMLASHMSNEDLECLIALSWGDDVATPSRKVSVNDVEQETESTFSHPAFRRPVNIVSEKEELLVFSDRKYEELSRQRLTQIRTLTKHHVMSWRVSSGMLDCIINGRVKQDAWLFPLPYMRGRDSTPARRLGCHKLLEELFVGKVSDPDGSKIAVLQHIRRSVEKMLRQDMIEEPIHLSSKEVARYFEAECCSVLAAFCLSILKVRKILETGFWRRW